MTNDTYITIYYFEVLSLISFTLFLFFYIKKINPKLRILSFYLALFSIIEVSAESLNSLIKSNLSLLPILTIGEFFILSFFFYNLILKTIIKKKKIAIIVFSTLCFLIIYFSYILNSINDFNSISKTIVHLLIISYCFIYFLLNIKQYGNINPESKQLSLNIIVASIMIYYSSSLLIFLFGNYIKTLTKAESITVLGINLILCLLYYYTIFAGLVYHIVKENSLSVKKSDKYNYPKL